MRGLHTIIIRLQHQVYRVLQLGHKIHSSRLLDIVGIEAKDLITARASGAATVFQTAVVAPVFEPFLSEVPDFAFVAEVSSFGLGPTGVPEVSA